MHLIRIKNKIQKFNKVLSIESKHYEDMLCPHGRVQGSTMNLKQIGHILSS